MVGVAAAVLAIASDHKKFALLIGWDIAAGLFIISVLATVLRYDATTTKSHALRDNPGRALGDVLLLAASIVSLFAVGLLLSDASTASGGERTLDIAIGLFSLIISWCAIHTTYLLTYTRLYYGKPEGGIGFNQNQPPTYLDFAYVAFTLGMTFQVSDTALQTRNMRSTVLKHTLLSYVFGTIIIASTINLVISLSQ
jgi:uncharacterized membrane protein